MKDPIAAYRQLTFEQKLILKTSLTLVFSAALTAVKFVVGLISNRDLCTVALYTAAMLLAKFECVKGARQGKYTFKARNVAVAVFLLISSAVYIGFMCRSFFVARVGREHGIVYVALLAFVSFAELGVALAGIFKTKDKGHYYRDVKIINFCIALMAILTTQMTILDFTGTQNGAYNAATGVGVGAFIAICAVYILIAPKISLIDREKCAFELRDGQKNGLVDMSAEFFELSLLKSAVFGGYRYLADVRGMSVDGKIVHGESMWRKLPIIVKILCCILSEILIFVWLIGRIVHFLRSIDLPGRLRAKMERNGFVFVDENAYVREVKHTKTPAFSGESSDI